MYQVNGLIEMHECGSRGSMGGREATGDGGSRGGTTRGW